MRPHGITASHAMIDCAVSNRAGRDAVTSGLRRVDMTGGQSGQACVQPVGGNRS